MIRTKEKFVKEMLDTLKSMPLEKREAFLRKVENNWLSTVRAKLKKDLENYWFCEKCRKYVPLKEVKAEKRTEIRNGVLLISDCGYGDDDVLGDVEYLVDSYICPKCGNRKDIKSEELRTLKEYSRK